jgi:hypothetical protein
VVVRTSENMSFQAYRKFVRKMVDVLRSVAEKSVMRGIRMASGLSIRIRDD